MSTPAHRTRRNLRTVCFLIVVAWLMAWTATAQPPGAGKPAPPPAQPPAPNANAARPAASDIELVERVLAARRDYQTALEQLRAFYVAKGDVERAGWAEEELLGFHRILKQAYRLELDVPPPTLQAAQNIPEANELYRRAMTWSRHPHAPWYLGGMSFIESSFFPVPPDVMLAPMCLAQPRRAWWFAWVTTFTSVAGGLFGNMTGFIEPMEVAYPTLTFGIFMVAMTLLGGKGTLWGPVLGATLFHTLKEVTWTYLLGWQWVALGLVIIVNVVYFQQGIMGWLRDRKPEWFGVRVEGR